MNDSQSSRRNFAAATKCETKANSSESSRNALETEEQKEVIGFASLSPLSFFRVK